MKSNMPALTSQLDQGQVDQALAWLTDLPQLPRELLPAQSEVVATVEAWTEPARPEWIMARAAAILSPYYAKDVPQIVREIEAEDWLEALAEYPQWAIERAARWWKGESNPDRRKAPLEGDIAARCKVEMGGIDVVPRLVETIRSRREYHTVQEPPRKIIDAETANRIMEEVGFRPRRFTDESKDTTQ